MLSALFESNIESSRRDHMGLQRKSDYLCGQSAEARERYESKVKCTGLNVDPYGIEESEWSQNPENIPRLAWSDVCLYMTSTPSCYTKEAVKVCEVNVRYCCMLLQKV